MILLDSHVLVWARADDRKLGRKARVLIDRHWSKGSIAVLAISFWELGILSARGRLRLDAPISLWREQVLADGVVELDLGGAVCVRSLDLIGLPTDPVDRFIVAAALVHGAALMTADEDILGWQHGLERHDARA